MHRYFNKTVTIDCLKINLSKPRPSRAIGNRLGEIQRGVSPSLVPPEGARYYVTMDVLSASHTRYNIQYHFVWIVKYRKGMLREKMKQIKLREIMEEIGKRYWFVIDTLGSDGDHVHCFLRAAPRYAPAEIMKIVKSISAKQMFKEFPEMRQQLWGGEFWGDGYYVSTVGDGVTVEIVRKYIEGQGKVTDHGTYEQTTLF